MVPPVRSQSASRTRLPVSRSRAKAVWVAMVEAPEPGLGLENAMACAFLGLTAGGSGTTSRRSRAMASRCVRQLEGRVQKLARARAQRLQNRLESFCVCRPTTCTGGFERRDRA